MLVYKNILLDKTNILPKNILEIGSRDGNDAEILRNAFNIKPENVWVVEPNPKQQNKIIEKYPKINLIKNAIFNQEKIMTFYSVDTEDDILNGISSLLNRIDNLYDTINTNKIEIKTMLGYDLLSIIDNDIDLCKIDVEGATFEILESFGEKIERINSMHVECEHRTVWLNQKLYDDVSKFLIEHNFKELYFSYCNNHTLQSDSIWVRKNFIK